MAKKYLIGNIQGTPGQPGVKGDKGDTGAPFSVYATYATIALMEEDKLNIPDGSFLVIQSNVNDPDNAKLYERTDSEVSGFKYICDMSGAAGATDFSMITNKPTTLAGYGITDAVQAVSGKGLSTEDYTTEEKTKLSGIATGAQVNVLESISVNGSPQTITNKGVNITIPGAATINGHDLTGTLTGADLGLVDAVQGKGLSTNDYDNTEKEKVAAAVTKAVDDLTNYYNKTNSYNKTEIDNMISSLAGIAIEVVAELPVSDIKTNTIYLVPNANPTTQNTKDEYLYIGSAWEKIGSTETDLTGYVTTTALNTALADYVEKVNGKGLSTNDFTTAYKDKLDGLNIKSISVNNTAQTVDGNGNVNLTIPSGHTITDGTTDFTNRAKLKFEGATITDDSANNQTVVSINGSTDYSVSIATSDWTQASGQSYYSATKTVNGIKAADTPIIDIVPTLANYEGEMTDWAKLIKAETAANNITFYASAAFTNAVSVLVKVV